MSSDESQTQDRVCENETSASDEASQVESSEHRRSEFDHGAAPGPLPVTSRQQENVAEQPHEVVPDDGCAVRGTPDPGSATGQPADRVRLDERDAEAAESLAGQDRSRRRVRLNPTVDASKARPVPSLGSAGSEVESSELKVESQKSPDFEPKALDRAEPSGTKQRLPEGSSEVTSADLAPVPLPKRAESVLKADFKTEHADTETTTATAEVIEEQRESETTPVERRESAVAGAPARTAPVALPPKEQALDADLEAEIEAALASADSEDPAARPPLGEASETTEPAEAQTPPLPTSEEDLESGTRTTGRIQSIHGDDVFLDVGFRSPGLVAARQFAVGKRPEVGQLIEVVVDRVDPNEGLIYVNLPKGLRKIGWKWEAVSKGQIVDCMVTKTNKGGLEITAGGLRGFLPASQVDLSFVSDLEPFVGQKLRVQVLEVNRRKRNLVVSRRAYLHIEQQQAEEELWKTLEVGQHLAGRVKTIKDYGAFVDVGGVDGFLHIGEISWTHIHHPADVLSEGDQIEVKVIGLDADRKKISLGLRQLMPNPWADVAEKYPAGGTVSGKVTRTTKFGAFVELEPGVEGLVHISELDHQRVNQVTDVLTAGREIDVKVLNVDPERKRIALSVKALREKPEDDAAAPTEAPPPRRPRRHLKGGAETGPGGGLFGNPADFA